LPEADRHGVSCHDPEPAGEFALKRGTPKIYIKDRGEREQASPRLCPDCGTPPARKIWCRSALPWSMDLTQVSRTDQG